MKTALVMETLRAAIKNRHAVLLSGAPGVGKTDLLTQAAQLEGADLMVTHPIVEDPTDKKGMPWITGQNDMGQIMRALARLIVNLKEGGNSDEDMLKAVDAAIAEPRATFLPFDDLRKLIDADRPLVCVLDDLGQAPPAIQASNMHLLLARHIGSHKVSDFVTFFAATNRRKDMAGVTGILEPVKSRFVTIIEVEPDPEDWCKWAISTGWMPFEVIAFIRWKPALLLDFVPTKDMSNSPCPRTWAMVGKLIAGNYPKEAERELIKGAVGEGAMTEFMAFVKIYRDLESPDMVIMNPEQAKVPKEPSTLFAMCGALSSRASDQTFGQIVKYANRLPAEFSVLLIKDCTTKDRGLVKSKPYIEWSLKHSHVLT